LPHRSIENGILKKCGSINFRIAEKHWQPLVCGSGVRTIAKKAGLVHGVDWEVSKKILSWRGSESEGQIAMGVTWRRTMPTVHETASG